MKRVYVVMCDFYDNDNNYTETYPCDVVSSMNCAEDRCIELEVENPEGVYYWQEVISSEEE